MQKLCQTNLPTGKKKMSSTKVGKKSKNINKMNNYLKVCKEDLQKDQQQQKLQYQGFSLNTFTQI